MTAEKNTEIWEKLRTPPEKAIKKITGGRLKGMSQISPQWRYRAITEAFGPVGKGWRFEIKERSIHDGTIDEAGNKTKFLFVIIDLFVKYGDEWSAPIPGCGGADLLVKEKYGIHTNTEALKMALTDALGAAMKMIGVAADIYMGDMGDSKYNDTYVDYALQRRCRDIFDQVKGGLSGEQANWCMDMMKMHKYRDVIDYLNGGK